MGDIDMWLIFAAAIVLAAPFIGGWYIRKMNVWLRRASAAWDSMEYHAGQLLQDKTLDPMIGDFVEAVVGRAGSSLLTNSFLQTIFKKDEVGKPTKIGAAITRLSEGQEYQFLHFMTTAIYYDSLRAGLRGVFLRRILYWLAEAAANQRSKVNEAQIRPIAVAASRAYHFSPC